MTGLEVLVALGSIVVIDIVLGGDNAILIALASKNLAPEQRKKAMFWGVVGAVAVRAALTAVALYLLKIPLLQFAGGVLLVWIALKLLLEDKKVECASATCLSEAIKTIIVADVVMGIDNVIAIAGAAHGSMLMVVLGLAISVPIIVWGSTFLLKWMDKYPAIVYIGAGVLAWTAGQMIVSDKIIARGIGNYIPYFEWVIPLVVLLGVILTGLNKNKLAKQQCKIS
ncbi:MAG: TerC family protein [Syntrophomonadaceae bacterium]|nr:TerC family protein [Syntrophomonadaceae bacterium]